MDLSLILFQFLRVVKQYVKIAWLFWRWGLKNTIRILLLLSCSLIIKVELFPILMLNDFMLLIPRSLVKRFLTKSRGEMAQQKIKELKQYLNMYKTIFCVSLNMVLYHVVYIMCFSWDPSFKGYKSFQGRFFMWISVFFLKNTC